jgi:hypothetical protein
MRHWTVNKKGRRAYGSKEFMRARLTSMANAVLTAKNEYELKHYAVHAWHWALALKGR